MSKQLIFTLGTQTPGILQVVTRSVPMGLFLGLDIHFSHLCLQFCSLLWGGLYLSVFCKQTKGMDDFLLSLKQYQEALRTRVGRGP